MISEIHAKSILRKQKKVESWFVSRYGMNLYRGCTHNCAYCDGRAETYNVEGEFGKDVAVKVNAIDLLRRELDPSRKRKPMPRGFMFVGGGVCDSYQPVESRYKLTRQTLELLAETDFPVHMLTKSTLIERDLDILTRINKKNRVIISMSFSSVDDKTSAVFEPGVPRPSKRLQTLSLFKKNGFAIGMYLMPVLPFITDTPQKIKETLRAAKDIGIDFIIFSGMTLKGGQQQEHFYKILKRYDAEFISAYESIYSDNRWGQARQEYCDSIHEIFHSIAHIFNIPIRVPPRLWSDKVDETDRVIIILEHMDYLLKLRGQKSPYGYAAFSISKLKEPIGVWRHRLEHISGVGKTTARLIREILDSDTSRYYEKLLSKKTSGL